MIQLEDVEFLTEEDLKKFGPPRQVFGALGQLELKGWIKKKVIRASRVYRLTTSGQHFIDKTLRGTHVLSASPSGWKFIVFDVPEARRNLRAQLRSILTSSGFGPLQPSVWVAPANKSGGLVEQFRLKHNLSSKIHFLSVLDWKPSTQTIYSIWNLKRLEKEYRRFVGASKKLLLSKSSTVHRMEAKKLIFWYALLVSQDPRLDRYFIVSDWPGRVAGEMYEKLRPLARS